MSPFIIEKSVNIALDGELKAYDSQKRQIPKKAKPMKNGKIPIIALNTIGNAAPNVLLMKVYSDALSIYREKDIQVSIQPKPRKSSVVVKLFNFPTI